MHPPQAFSFQSQSLNNPHQQQSELMKNKPNTTILGRVTAAGSAGLLLAGAVINGSAAVRTWDGGGDGYFWSNPVNWDGDTAAPANGDDLVFSGTVGLTNYNDLAGDTDFLSVTFAAGAGAFQLDGNSIQLGTGGNAGVTNSSSVAQTFNLEAKNNRTTYYDTTGADIINTKRLWDWRWYKHGPNKLVHVHSVSGLNGNLLGIDGGTEVFACPVGGVIGHGLTINAGGTIQVVGPSTDQIHYNQDIYMTGGTFQLQTTNASGNPAFEEVASLKSASVDAVVENGSALGPVELQIGGGTDKRALFAGSIRDGGAGAFGLKIYRKAFQELRGTNSYSGPTVVDNSLSAGITRLIVNGLHTGGGDYTVSGSAAGNYASLCGSGTVSASAVNVGTQGVLSPGGALAGSSTTQNNNSATFSDSTGVLTLNAPVALGDPTSAVELTVAGTTPTSGYDQIVIGGSGTLFNNNADLQLAIDVLFTPAPGDQFTLVQVQGTDPTNNVGVFASLNGTPTDLSQGATFSLAGYTFQISYRAEGSTFDAGAGSGNDIMIEALASAAADLTWRGNGTDNNWDITATANWWNGSSLVTFTNGDSVTFDNSGSNNTPVNLVADLSPAKVEVQATQDYILGGSGKLTGAVFISKTNTGTLTLVTDNDYAGGTVIQQGKLQLGTNGTTGSILDVVTVDPSGILAYNRSDDIVITNAAFQGTGSVEHNGSGKLTVLANLNPGFEGTTTVNGGILQLGDGTTSQGNLGGVVTVPAGEKLYYYFSGGSQVNIPNSLSGSGGVDYDGSFGQTMRIESSAVSSNFTGTITVTDGGRLWTWDGNAGYALGNGSTVNVPQYSQVWLDRSATTYNQVFNITGTGYVGDYPELGALRVFGCTLNGQINLLADSRIGGTISGATIRAPITGNYQLEVLGTTIDSFILQMGPTNGTHTYASTRITAGAVRALNANALSTGPLVIEPAGKLQVNGYNVTVASLAEANSGLVTGPGAIIENFSGSAPGTLTVGTDNSDGSYSGTFRDGGSQPFGLTKDGSGTVTVFGTTDSTGPVTVNGGTLALSGSSSFANASHYIANATLDVSGIGGTLTLNSGQTLGGKGTVSGQVTAEAGSVVSPGASVGTLTVSGHVSLNGLLLMELDRTNAPFNSDRLLSSGGTITYGGSLLVTNIGPALQVDDTFQLFPAGVTGFGANITLATTDATGNTYTWQNNVATLGSVKVLSVTPPTPPVNPTPTNIVVSVSGGNLNLSWPASHTGWSLQAQTNTLGVGLATNWTTLGYENTNAVSIPIDAANPTVFYRLFYVAP
jgi:autotransporter-associated beta strand protein